MNPSTINDNIIAEDTLINNNGRGHFNALSERCIWEVQMRDYVENISLGLPSARLSEQHSLTIVDDDESSWTKSHLRPGG